MVWSSNVMLVDLESGNQLGECWIVEVPETAAQSEAEAIRAIRQKAWEEVDSRLNDVSVELVDGPIRY